jgi:hypothetical protein
VHPYTFRREKESLPPYAASFEALLEFFYFKVGVDGVFTDYCGDAVRFLHTRPVAPAVEAVGGERLPSQPVVAPEAPDEPQVPETSLTSPGSAREPGLPLAPAVPAVAAPQPTTVPATPGTAAPAPRRPIVITGPEPVAPPVPVSVPAESKYR